MKTSKNFRLSDEAVSILDKLSKEHALSKTGVVEMLLRERRASNPHENSRRKHEHCRVYINKTDVIKKVSEHLKDNSNPMPHIDSFDFEKSFYAGYDAGWLAFQNRHALLR